MNINEIANQLKALGLRVLGAPIWVKSDTTPKFAGVTAPIKTVVVNGQTLNSLQLATGQGEEFVTVRLGKGVPANKQSYDIFLYKAVRSWPTTEKEKKDFPNVTPINMGDLTAFAH